LPGVTGPIVQFTTVSGRFNVELFTNGAPRHAANFLTYANARAYDNTIFSHIARNGNVAATIQGGVFVAAVPPTIVPQNPPVELEYGIPNTRGTLAAARGTDPNSARSEWFFNLQDNVAALGPGPQGPGYSVFGRVLGTGMTIVDALAAFPTFSFANTPFTQIPLRNVGANQTTLTLNNYIVLNSVRPIPLYPSTVGETSVLSFTATRSSTTVINIGVLGSTLTIFPLAVGNATVSVRATDTNGAFVDTTFPVTVTTQPLLNPLFTNHPSSHTVPTGSTVALITAASGFPSYQWLRNGAPIPGATGSRLLLPAVTAADAALYSCLATNVVGSTTSAPATLSVVPIAPAAAARLGNLSILTSAGGTRPLTMGAVVGPVQQSATLPLIARAVGPTLSSAPFNVQGVLADPRLVANRGGVTEPVASNDNWGGSATLSSAFTDVGAFALPPGSLDSAAVVTAIAGSYTIQVSGAGDVNGAVIAELYDGAGANRTEATPRLINVSTLAEIDPASSLTVGFVLTGQGSRTVLVRGVGPSLAGFGVPGAMEDPRLELFDNEIGQRIAENDDWGGDAALAAVSTSVGAFSLGNAASKDAAILVTLRPGAYSARILGANNTGGAAIVEVYEVR
jgi:cyclophilin family peptidyl-prolyl cis-trans isomerase